MKSLVPYLAGALWPVVCVRRLWPLGLVHQQASWSLSTLSGHDVSRREESQRRRVPARVIICCRKGDPFQGQKVGFFLSLRNKLLEETCAENARDLIGKGYPGREQ